MSVPYTYILAEKDGQQVKIPYNEFADRFVSYTASPSSPNTEGGQQGMFSADAWVTISGTESVSSSGYVYSNNAWRKIPTYTTNWDDLDAVVNEDNTVTYLRFLPVHKRVELSEEEIAIAKENIDVSIATNTHPGLVMGSPVSEEYGAVTITEEGAIQAELASTTHAGAVILVGGLSVDVNDPTAHIPQVYTKQAIDEKFTSAGSWRIPVATTETVGGVVIGSHLNIEEGGRLNIDEASVQAIPQYGVVRYAPESYNPSSTDNKIDEDSYVLSINQIKQLTDHLIKTSQATLREIPLASADVIGGVRIGVNSNVELVNEALKVRSATTEVDGAVQLLNEINANNSQAGELLVPTAYAVKNYVDAIAANKLPIASTTTLGGIKVGPNMSITADGVLKLNLPLASFEQNTAGIVNLTNNMSESNISASLIPTASAVSKFVNDKIKQQTNTIVPAANSVMPGVVLVEPTQTESPTNTDNVYIVPTELKVKELIQDGIEEYNSTASILSSERWLVIGTGSFTQEAVDQAIAKNPPLPAAIVVSSHSEVSPSQENEAGETTVAGGTALAAGINLLKFSEKVPLYTVQTLVANLSETKAGYYDSNFLIMPAAAGMGNFLS